jgi:hypothetical protein
MQELKNPPRTLQIARSQSSDHERLRVDVGYVAPLTAGRLAATPTGTTPKSLWSWSSDHEHLSLMLAAWCRRWQCCHINYWSHTGAATMPNQDRRRQTDQFEVSRNHQLHGLRLCHQLIRVAGLNAAVSDSASFSGLSCTE